MKAPAWQMYAADWLADEDILDMELDEEGAYARLLNYQWREGSIPADPVKLRRRLKGVHGNQFNRIWDRIKHKFVPVSDVNPNEIPPNSEGNLINIRLNSERIAMEMRSISRRENALKRWEPLKTPDATAQISECSSSSSSSSPSSSSASSVKEERTEEAGKRERPSASRSRKPAELTPYKKQILERHRAACEVLWSLQDDLRKQVSSTARKLTPTDSALFPIAERLEEGATIADCEHVLAVCQAEAIAKQSLDAAFFNGVTTWKRENFARKLGGEVRPFGNGENLSAQQLFAMADEMERNGR